MTNQLDILRSAISPNKSANGQAKSSVSSRSRNFAAMNSNIVARCYNVSAIHPNGGQLSKSNVSFSVAKRQANAWLKQGYRTTISEVATTIAVRVSPNKVSHRPLIFGNTNRFPAAKTIVKPQPIPNPPTPQMLLDLFADERNRIHSLPPVHPHFVPITKTDLKLRQDRRNHNYNLKLTRNNGKPAKQEVEIYSIYDGNQLLFCGTETEAVAWLQSNPEAIAKINELSFIPGVRY